MILQNLNLIDHYVSRASLARKEGGVESAGHKGPHWDTGEGVLLQDSPEVDGRVADGRREEDHPIIVWIVFSANDRGKKCDKRERVWRQTE